MYFCDWQTISFFFREVLFNFSAIFLWNTHTYLYLYLRLWLYINYVYTHIKCIEIISFITYFIPFLFPLNFFPNILPVTAPLKMLFPHPHHLDTPPVVGYRRALLLCSQDWNDWDLSRWQCFMELLPICGVSHYFLPVPKCPLPHGCVCVCLSVCDIAVPFIVPIVSDGVILLKSEFCLQNLWLCLLCFSVLCIISELLIILSFIRVIAN